ncbi:MAG: OmpA family protein [Bdellovibrionota bacterium]
MKLPIKSFFTFLTLITMVFLSGCTSPGKRTAIGAGTGAAVGGALGGAAGGWSGAGIGAAAGAATGAAIGNYLDKQAKELSKVADTKRLKDGILVDLKNDLLFETGSAVLKPSAVDQLVEVGDILAKYKENRVRVEGHTDNTGSDAFNERLSVERAEAVQRVLRSRGVKEEQMSVVGFGEAKPVATNSSENGRARNRRVQLFIDVDQETVKRQPAEQRN